MVSPGGPDRNRERGRGALFFAQGKALAAPLLTVQSVAVANPDGTTLSTYIEQVELSEQTYLPLIVQE